MRNIAADAVLDLSAVRCRPAPLTPPRRGSSTSVVSDAPSSIDPAEVARFSAIADEWWDPRGKFAPLHRFNPVRLDFIREQALARFGRDGAARRRSRACSCSTSAAAAACSASR